VTFTKHVESMSDVIKFARESLNKIHKTHFIKVYIE